jgi:tripartite-type tricarboxylate transporter receptor subunit TctC
LSALLGQSVVVKNKTGGGGVVGTYAAKAEPPDGYTVVVLTPAQLGAPLLIKDVTFDITKDFIVVNLAISSTSLIVVRKDFLWMTLEELGGEAKKDPGKLTYSSNGYGSTQHFTAELLKMAMGPEFQHIPFVGAGKAIAAILGGHVDVNMHEFGSLQKYLEAGTLRALGVMSKERLKAFPDIPTFVEKGFPNLVFGTWQGFFVRTGTTREIIQKLDKAFKEVMSDKETIGICEKAGWVVENLGSNEAARFVAQSKQQRADAAKAAKLVPK